MPDAPAPAVDQPAQLRRESASRGARRRWTLGWAGSIAAVILVIYLVAAVAAPEFLTHRANSITGATPFLRPSSAHLFGTDGLGRDVFARVLVATRVALLAAVESVAMAAVLGTLLGVFAGYLGGVVDELLSRLLDLLFSLPSYLLGIVVIVVLGRGETNAALAIALVFTPQFGRIARAATIEIRHRAYIDSARLSGRGVVWILLRHVVPNITTPLSVMVGVTLSSSAGAYAVLSYLGFGVTPPAADYGSMLADNQQYMTSDPWLIFFPAAALVVLIIGFVLLGDWMSDRLDPTSRIVAGTAPEVGPTPNT